MRLGAAGGESAAFAGGLGDCAGGLGIGVGDTRPARSEMGVRTCCAFAFTRISRNRAPSMPHLGVSSRPIEMLGSQPRFRGQLRRLQ